METKSSRSFLSTAPIVKLEKAFSTPFKNVVATARTCYSNKGIIQDENVKEGFESLAQSIYQAGHHTTYQHAHFQFTISNVSRQFVWSFLHSHPFYNSEQVSQRYVAVKPDSYIIPSLNEKALSLYLKTIEEQMEAYKNLTELLMPVISAEYNKVFTKQDVSQPSVQQKLRKKSIEVARYVLPIGTFSYLYHTISGVTLLRYWRLCETYDVPDEQREVIGLMVKELLAYDPLYQVILEDPLPLEQTPEFAFFQLYQNQNTSNLRKQFVTEFDKSLCGYTSKLTAYKNDNEAILAASVREVFGMPASYLNDNEAIAWALDPRKNNLLGETLNLSTISKLARTMVHPSYTFRKKISHTADSQDQRHRMTPASRPILSAHFTQEPDYITPAPILENELAKNLYQQTMERTWENINHLLKLGVKEEYALYLLPNAVSVRFTESTDLLNLHHKHKMRLCYLAQEEIWQASVEEAQQIRRINPNIGAHLLPPCTHRYQAGTKPICPEGNRFCGIRVWKLDLDEYNRII